MKNKSKMIYLILGLWCITLIFISYKVARRDDKMIFDRERIELEIPTGTLYGTLEIPEGLDEFPVVLVISGSGPTDRDGNSIVLDGNNDSLKMLCEGLAKQGIATVRYDKRGVGESFATRPEEKNLEFDVFINDAVLWIEKLKKDQRFSKVGVMGHSEGALIGIVAAQRTNVDAYVSLTGHGRSIYDVLLEQLTKQPKEIFYESQEIIAELRKGNQVSEVSLELQPVFRPSIQPFLMSMAKYEPTVEIKKLDIPILIISGTTDLQVSKDDGDALYKARSDASYKIIEGMNHVLKEAPLDFTSNWATYSDPTLPLAPGLLEEVSSFLRKALK